MELANRKLPRLKNFDYAAAGYYFVTLCTHRRTPLFVGDGLDCSAPFVLNRRGEIAEEELLRIPEHFDGVAIDQYCVMPNHLHVIIVIGCNGEAERSRPFPTLSTVVGLYKSGVSKRLGMPVWQKSFHDHIIRGRKDYEEI